MLTADSLLRDIKGTDASQWLASVRYHTAPFGPSFISELDALLTSTHPRATPEAPFQAGDVIEVQGDTSTGKSQILLHLALVTSLPSTAPFKLWSPESADLLTESIEIGGKGQAVVLFDMDGRFDLPRLKHMMLSHFERRIREHCEDGPQKLHQARPSPQEVMAQVDLALGRILYLTPSSLIALAASIKLVPQMAAQHFPKETLSLLLIDSLTTAAPIAAWDLEQARQAAEITPPVKPPPGSVKMPLPQHSIRQVLRCLGALRKETGITTFLTTAGVTPLSARSVFYKPALPPPYPSPFEQDTPRQARFDPQDPLASEVPLRLTHHLTLHARPLPQLPADVTRDQSLGEKGQHRRFLVDNRQMLRVYVRLAGVGQVNAQDGSALAGAFEMRVLNSGIDA